MEITEEHLRLIWLGKKFSCEKDCYCHAECNEADEYIDKLRKQVKSTLAPISLDEQSEAAVCDCNNEPDVFMDMHVRKAKCIECGRIVKQTGN